MTTAPSEVESRTSSHGESTALLVVPPYHGLGCPALGVSQLKANLLAAGFHSEVLYLNLRFAQRIGTMLYEWLSGTGPYLLGDLIFSQIGHDRTDDDLRRYCDEVIAGTQVEEGFKHWTKSATAFDGLRGLVDQARAFVDEDAVPEMLARNPWLVGMSSTFQANCSSVTLLRAVKRAAPEVLTMMGGANCEAEMGAEIRKLYPEIDFVGRGECDKTIVELVRNLKSGGDGSGVDGFLAKAATETPPSRPLHGPDLDAQPHADLDDYFEQLNGLEVAKQVVPGLVAETSRGCWWGAKQHCTFCAFNREGMVFRSKQPERALAEISAQIEKFGLTRMELTDNILDMAYFKSLVPALASGSKAEFFWETKANLARDQVRMMADAGIRWIQPGIESLSDLSLKLMRKGSTQLQNVQLLKNCTESGVRITWNWLYGFPGEDDSEIADHERTARALAHLQPPSGTSVLYLERFAPYHTSPEEWGLTGIRPSKAYGYVYPFAEEALNNLAFFFECDHFSEKERGEPYQRLRKLVQGWKGAWGRAHFIAVPRSGNLMLLDTRPGTKRFHRKLTGVKRKVYEFCWKIRGERDIVRHFESEADADQVRAILKEFCDDMLMLQRGDRYLALATDPRYGYRAFPKVFPGGSITEGRPAPPRADTVSLPGKSWVRRVASVLTGKRSLVEMARNKVMHRTLAKARAERPRFELGESPEVAPQPTRPLATAKTA